MRVRWVGVGWFAARPNWSGWCMLEEGLCVNLLVCFLGCDHTHAVFGFCFLICFCMPCLQKTSENMLIHVDVFPFDSALTTILPLFSFWFVCGLAFILCLFVCLFCWVF